MVEVMVMAVIVELEWLRWDSGGSSDDDSGCDGCTMISVEQQKGNGEQSLLCSHNVH